MKTNIQEIELRLFDAEGNDYNTNEPINKMWYEEEFFKHFKSYMPYKHYGTRWRIMQFTGLIDKNGKKIYDGDIINEVYIPIGVNKNHYEYSKIGVVTNIGYCFGIIIKFDKGTQLIPECCMSHQINYKKIYTVNGNTNFFDKSWFKPEEKMEVIGNIYENPELLNL